MRQVASNTWVLRSAAVLTALVGLGWFAPSRAMASCGDYVTMTPHHGDSVPSLPSYDVAIPAQFLPNDALLASAGGRLLHHATAHPLPCRRCPVAPGQAPCHGPWCSGDH